MGLFNTYGTAQLKAGELDLLQFEVGDAVSIPDGVYLGTEVIVIIDGKLAGTFDTVNDNWGHPISYEELDNEYN